MRALFLRLRLREAVLAADDAPTVAARRLENLDEVVASVARFSREERSRASPLGDFLHTAALVPSSREEREERGGCVTLMTLHSAKGLEFPYVFMVGMEEGSLPHKNSTEGAGDLSEERRLCYVGMTRARKRLWLTYAAQRVRYGKLTEVTPSRFLQEINVEGAVERLARDDAGANAARAEAMAEEFFAKMRTELGMD